MSGKVEHAGSPAVLDVGMMSRDLGNPRHGGYDVDCLFEGWEPICLLQDLAPSLPTLQTLQVRLDLRIGQPAHLRDHYSKRLHDDVIIP